MKHVYKLGPLLPVPQWAGDPCCVCGKETEAGSIIHLDFAMGTVMCDTCHDKLWGL